MTEATSWTYQSQNDSQKIVVSTIENAVVKALSYALRSMEDDPLIDLPAENRRALLGKIAYDATNMLRAHTLVWDSTQEKAIPQEVRFALEFVEQSIVQSYAKDIADLTHRWKTLSPDALPFDVGLVLRTIYTAQSQQALNIPAQKRILMFVEKAMLEQLGFLFLELRTRFDEWNIPGPTSGVSSTTPSTAEDEALFNSLCNFLESWEPSAEMLNVIGAPSRMLSPAEVLAVVSNLQKLVPQMLEDALGHPDGRLAQNIKDSMVQHAEEMLGFDKGNVTISPNDAQAVDLVDDVFTQNLYERKIHHASRTILAQILFPSVKAALLNRRWFAQQEHPAREFIASVSDSVAPASGVLEKDVVEQAAQAVHRLVTGFNEDVSIFGVLTQEIHEFQEEKKEQEWEQLVVCREEVRGELRKTWSRLRAPQPVMDFALELGGEYLADLHQKGERLTPKWEAALTTLHQLLTTKSTLSNKVKIDGLLRDRLMDMLLLCGWTGVRAHNRLAEQEDVIHAYYVLGQREFPTVASFPLPPRPHRRVLPSFLEQPEGGANNAPSLPLHPHKTLEDLKINDYVEWINSHGERLGLRLSYISPLSMKHLFVNDSGARVLVGNPKELKKLMDTQRLFL